ncbi:hypothetical protein SLA2020_024550 [Shorea laevis]
MTLFLAPKQGPNSNAFPRTPIMACLLVSHKKFKSTTLRSKAIAQFKKFDSLHRYRLALAMVVVWDHKPRTPQVPKPQSEASFIIRQAVSLLTIYLALGVVIYITTRKRHKFGQAI